METLRLYQSMYKLRNKFKKDKSITLNNKRPSLQQVKEDHLKGDI